MEPTPLEARQPTDPPSTLEARNARAGALVLLALIFILPLVLAYLFGACSLALAAWHLMIGQLT